MPVIHLGGQMLDQDILAQLEGFGFDVPPPPRRTTPSTFVGGILLPLVLVLCVMWWAAPRVLSPVRLTALRARGSALRPLGGVNWGSQLLREHVTRVCVSIYFVHEGAAEWQRKLAAVHGAFVPVPTLWGGTVRLLPRWEKGDAVDLVLLITASLTMFNVMPEIGFFLLLVDVATDVIDMTAQAALNSLIGGEGSIFFNELAAKKLSLLGVMALVAIHRWRAERVSSATTGTAGGAERGSDPDPGDAAKPLSSLLLLMGRLLIAVLFFYVGSFELGRLLLSPDWVDIDPLDRHNILWPKALELALAVPFVLGYNTRAVSRLLAATLVLEALTVWQWWWVADRREQLHEREHCAVSIAVAGGLLLLQEVGGGRYTIDELLAKSQ